MANGVRGCVLGLCGSLVLACGGAELPPAAEPPATAPGELAVRRGDFESRFLLSGEIAAFDAIQIAVPRTPSWQVQIRWLAEDGAVVEAGAPILELDNSSFASDLEEKRLKVTNSRGELATRKAALAAEEAEAQFQVEQKKSELETARLKAGVPADLLARREWEERQLAQRKAELEVSKAESQLASKRAAARAELAQLELDLASEQREIEQAEAAIRALAVKAPRAGVVRIADHPWERRRLREGDRVFVGAVVLTMPDPGRLKVEARLPDADSGRLAVGQRVVCRLDAFPAESFAGVVESITPMAREEGEGSLRRFFAVAIEPEGIDLGKARLGLSTKIEVKADRRPAVLLAPRAALDLVSEPPRALTRDGRAVEVRLGPCNAQECVVESGLSEGVALRRRA